MRKNNGWKSVLTFFGLGYIPLAPGTMGALGAFFPAILIILYVENPNLLLLFLILVSGILGVIGSNQVEKEWGKDPSRIVIDEVVGLWISVLWLPPGLWYAVLAFIFFRLFDIFKPLGIRSTEALKGGFGVMADDIVAGVYANISTQIVYLVLKLTK